MSNKPVIVKKSFHASASAIWEALTNNKELKRWYFQLEDLNLKPVLNFHSPAVRMNRFNTCTSAR